jgi:hypothetical protein
MRFRSTWVLLTVYTVFLTSCKGQEASAKPEIAEPPEAGCKYSGASLGLNAPLGGAVAFHANHWSRQPLSAYPADPNSSSLICTVDTQAPCGHNLWPHPGFGSSPANGIPYYVVDNSQPMVPITITSYSAESDPATGVGIAPLPNDGKIIESYMQRDGDHHAIVLNKDSCWLYELNRASYDPASHHWTANQVSIWDLSSDSARPIGWTSADASGLPIFPTLVKYEEAHSGTIHHVIRGEFTNSRAAFVLPALHYTTSGMGSNFPPMGMRWRLKPSFDTTLGGKATKEVRAILNAMKTYGLINQDNSGGGFFVDGVPDPRWDDETLHNQLASIHLSDFEFVTNNRNGAPTTSFGPEGTIKDWPDGKAPAISGFSATPSSDGTSTLNYSTSGASYIIISPEVGPLRGASGTAVVHPTRNTTYTLTATNQYGRKTHTVGVKVSGGSYSWDSPSAPLLALWDFTSTDGMSCSGACADGVAITAYNDKSGNGHNLGFGAGVTYRTGVQGVHNPISVARFGGDPASINTNLPKQSSYTIVAILKPAANGMIITGIDAESGYAVSGHQILVDQYRREDGGKAKINNTVFHQMNVTYDTKQIKFRLDGSADGSVNSNSTAQTTGFFILGGSQSGGYSNFRGDIAAIAIYKGAMSQGDLSKLENFINSKY